MKKNKLLIASFIIGGCILGFLLNPYVGVLTISVPLRTTLQAIFQFVITIYILAFYVFPSIIKAIKHQA